MFPILMYLYENMSRRKMIEQCNVNIVKPYFDYNSYRIQHKVQLLVFKNLACNIFTT